MNDETRLPTEELYSNAYQVREEEDPEAVKELAENILHNATVDFDGLLQIPTVRVISSGYELVFGHSRKAAFEYLFAQGHERYRSMRVNVRELTDLQMFELGVGENMKRRDLNPMEEAHAIHTYMTVFKKSSTEAGEFFNKSPEAVRGAIRLANLPEKAQAKLKSGEINVTTARALLVVGKVAGEKQVDQVLKEIDDNRDDTPMEIIESTLRESDDVDFISHEDWLNVPVFPVKHLEPITKKDIEAMLADDNVPPETLERLMQYIQAGMEIVYSDWTLPVEKIERIRVLVNPPACEKCQLHAVLDGDHYCGYKPCSERKSQAWEKHEKEMISVAVGIPLYEKSDGPHADLNTRETADKKLFKDRHADLRLMSAQNMWNNFDGLSREVKVVAVGELYAKRKKKADAARAAEPAKKKEPERDWQLESRIRDLARAFEIQMTWEAAPFFAVVLDGLTNMVVLTALSKEYNLSAPKEAKPRKDAKKADALRQVRRYLAYCILRRFIDVSYSEQKPISKISKDCVKAAAAWGVKLPKDWSAQVEKFQAEYDAAKKDVIEKRKAEKK